MELLEFGGLQNESTAYSWGCRINGIDSTVLAGPLLMVARCRFEGLTLLNDEFVDKSIS